MASITPAVNPGVAAVADSSPCAAWAPRPSEPARGHGPLRSLCPGLAGLPASCFVVDERNQTQEAAHDGFDLCDALHKAKP